MSEEKTHNQWMPNETQRQQIRAMSGFGMPYDQMAAILGVSKSTLERAINRDDSLHEVIAEGRATASYNMRKTAYEQGSGYFSPVYGLDGKPEKNEDGSEKLVWNPPDRVMTQFWLKTQERFAERIELTGEGGKPIELSMEEKEERAMRIAKQLALTDPKHDDEPEAKG